MRQQRKGKENADRESHTLSPGLFIAFTMSAVVLAILIISLSQIQSFPTISPSPNPSTPKPTPTSTIIVPSSLTAAMSKGALNALVTIIEYSDFQCAHCQTFAESVEKEFEAAYIDTGKVRLVYKFMVGWGDDSWRADEAAACAAEQGQFWPFYYLLMEQHASPSKDNDLPVEKLQGLAQQLGLDMNRFNASFLTGKYEALVDQQDNEGRALGITSTPVFFINGIKQEGAPSLKVLQDIIDPILEELGK